MVKWLDWVWLWTVRSKEAHQDTDYKNFKAQSGYLATNSIILVPNNKQQF